MEEWESIEDILRVEFVGQRISIRSQFSFSIRNDDTDEWLINKNIEKSHFMA